MHAFLARRAWVRALLGLIALVWLPPISSAGWKLRPQSRMHHERFADSSETGREGFGLGYHLGYGYGGRALGVGPFGGYAYYGGPGYPQPAPQLRRFGKITPFV